MYLRLKLHEAVTHALSDCSVQVEEAHIGRWNSIKGDHDCWIEMEMTVIKGREIRDGDNRVTA